MKKFFERNLGFIVCILIMACVIVIEGCLLKAQHDISKLNERLTIVEEEVRTLENEKVVITKQPVKSREIVIERVEESENDILEVVTDIRIEPVVEEKTELVDSDKLYTEDDVIAAAKMVWGEAGAVPELKNGDTVISTKCQQAATIWTALNQYDMGGFSSIKAVIASPGKYHGYYESNPATDELVELARDVLDRWNRERNGETDVGRVLPADYIYFHGDGTYNYFRNEYEGGTRWAWDYGDPYAE